MIVISRNRYLLFQKAEAALLEEKGAKLFGITRILDRHLKGTYNDLLRQIRNQDDITSLKKEEKIKILSNALYPFTDTIAAAFPGVGVGYYSKELDAIITYGPGKKYSKKVGISIDKDHIGRKAMLQGREIVGVGSMVRGEIMNCVHPLIRRGEVIGFTWANETVEDIYKQIGRGAQKIFFSPNIQPVLGLTGLLLFCSKILILNSSLEEQLCWTVIQMQRYLKTFLNSLNIGIIIADVDNRIVFVNQGLEEILGLELKSLYPQYYNDYHMFLDRIGFREISKIINQLIQNNKNQYFSQSTITLPSGHVRDINFLIAFLKSENEISGTVILFEDLECLKEEENKMKRADKLAALGELSASIAHEIRNPLAIVLGSLQILPRRLGDRDFLYSFLRIATQELVRVNNSIEALLDFARFSQPDFTLVNINNLLNNVITFFAVTLENQNIKIKTRFSPLPAIEADETQIKQALINIILNAIQAMPQGGILEISTQYRQGDKFVKVVISDTGMGIDEKCQPYIFDAFYSTKEKGTGLGLSLVHRVIDEHQGIIEFISKVNQGTTFFLHLPVRQFNLLPGNDKL